jgi:hypothetical protein
MAMAMNSDATPKHGGSGGGELEKRVTAVETRVAVIEKTMITVEVFQRELGAFRDEMRVAMGSLSDEMRRAIGSLREEIGALRGEMHVGFGDVRKEMQVGFVELRSEMQAQDGALRVEVTKAHVEIAKTPFETFKWLLAAAGLAAAIATAIYNIWFR